MGEHSQINSLKQTCHHQSTLSLVSFVLPLTALGVPILCQAAIQNDVFRKPRTGMWTLWETEWRAKHGIIVDRAKSLYVGDAAGSLFYVYQNVKKTSTTRITSLRSIWVSVDLPYQKNVSKQANPYLINPIGHCIYQRPLRLRSLYHQQEHMTTTIRRCLRLTQRWPYYGYVLVHLPQESQLFVE